MNDRQGQAEGAFIVRVLRMATAAPGFKPIAAVFGIGVLVATLAKFGISLLTIGLGIVCTLLLSVLYLAFTWVSSIQRKHRSALAVSLAYSVVFTITAGVFLAFSSVFFDGPLPLKTSIIHRLNGASASLNVKSIISDLTPGATVQFAESKIGSPFYYDDSLRQYKLLDGKFAVFLFQDRGRITAAYFEWRAPPAAPYPQFKPVYREGAGDLDKALDFGSATFGNLIDSVLLSCQPVTGDSSSKMLYIAVQCESRLGARDPWFYVFGMNHQTKDNLGPSDLEQSNSDIRSIQAEVFNILLVTRDPESLLYVMRAQDQQTSP